MNAEMSIVRERLKVQPAGDRRQPGYNSFKIRDERVKVWLGQHAEHTTTLDLYG